MLPYSTGNNLNLPDKVFFPDGSRIDISYDGDGNVLRKFITSTTDTLPNDEMTMQVDYVAGFMYVDGGFQSFSHAQGRVNKVVGGTRNEYFLRDHLGNTRVVYSDLNINGVIELDTLMENCELLEEYHYYPFGMEMEMWWSPQKDTITLNRYRYNGKEQQRELGWDWYNYGARYYDASIGRFSGVDPLADHPKQVGASPYAYCNNNPIRFIDPMGMIWEDPKQAERLEKSVNKRIEGIEKNSTKIQSQIDNGKLSDKKLERLQGQLAENKDMVKLLNQSLSDIQAIGEAAEVYRLTGPSSNDGSHRVIRDDSGVINIEGSNTGLHLHEIRHVGQSMEAGGVRFDKEGYLLNAANTINGAIDNEVNAYQVQFSFDGSYPAGARSLKDINAKSLMDIRLPDGTRVYKALEPKR